MVLLSCLYLRKKIDLGDFGTLLLLIFFGNHCGRLVIYACLFTCPIVADALTQSLRHLLSVSIVTRFCDALRLVAASRFYVLIVLLISSYVVISQPLFLRRNVPVQASKYLAQHPVAGNLFCTAHAGSYLIYSLRGKIKVFMDTRLDLYDVKFVERFARALNAGKGWKELFAQYKITEALISNELTLKEVLDKQPDWKPIYTDNDFTLYSHTSEY
jgi:hypothetical protein